MNNDTTDVPASLPNWELSATTVNGQARLEAVATFAAGSAATTSLVPFSSEGYVLVLGPPVEAVNAARRISGDCQCTVLVSARTDEAQGQGTESERFTVVSGALDSLDGHLGAFVAMVTVDAGAEGPRALNLAGLHAGREHFDLVLDLHVPPVIDRDVPPLGYYAPGSDPTRLEACLAELPEMVGDFEKPRFFSYDPSICAHGSRGLTGCTRCLDACPTDAIISIGEKVEVNPYLCQGAGSCVSSCPSGAMAYAYPPASDLLRSLRGALRAFHAAGGTGATLLFHDDAAGALEVETFVGELPEYVIPVRVEEIGSLGMDTWFAALAYGAARVLLYVPREYAAKARRALEEQIGFAGAILQGMANSPLRIGLIDRDVQDVGIPGLTAPPMQDGPPAATFETHDDKRRTVRLAVEHLARQSSVSAPVVPLPSGAPFGDVLVDRDACTLCMACASVCPTRALLDGGDSPSLRFVEANCVQCGLCRTACPENAVELAPRFVYDHEVHRQTRVLNEDAPFHCVGCGKPFATRKIIENMSGRLKEHWMFQNPEALLRLQMCGDCRVQDMFASNDGTQSEHTPS